MLPQLTERFDAEGGALLEPSWGLENPWEGAQFVPCFFQGLAQFQDELTWNSGPIEPPVTPPVRKGTGRKVFKTKDRRKEEDELILAVINKFLEVV